MKLWKIQKFFGDVVYDLRNRGLLPVVILLLVAMVAVPVVISRGSSDSEAPSIQPAGGFADLAPEAQTAVVAYAPGVRDYKKRLEGLSPEDPFRQQFAQAAAKATELTSTVQTPTGGGSSGTGSGSPSTGSTTAPGSTGGSGSGKKKQKKRKKAGQTTYTYSLTVEAGEANGALTPFPDLASLTPLPGPTTPVVVYYGLSSDFGKALFLVSNKVDSLTGPGTCLPAPDDCSLLALGPGDGEDLHYTQDDKTYRIVVSEIQRVAK